MSHNPFKSNNPFRHNDDYAPPSGPPPSHGQSQGDYAPPSGPPPSHARSQGDYAPPSGPPPSHSRVGGDDYAPPPGPPPSNKSGDDYAPPSGPPPPKKSSNDYAPPPGPPPKKDDHKPEAWELAVPDTSLFPPPPNIFSGYDKSDTTNATEYQAEAGEAWCKKYPLAPPLALDEAGLAAISPGSHNNLRLIEPAQASAGGIFAGKLSYTKPGSWSLQTDKSSGDACIVGYPPLYSVKTHSPLAQGNPSSKSIYYEVNIHNKRPSTFSRSKATEPVGLALGFTALPYPSFRMPGWHRGSLAVHGDDGHKYINDRWGGKDFTQPFKVGETYGIGMTVSNAGKQGALEVEVFFTKGGRETGRWNLHEETDAEEDLPVTGLEGFHDLSVAVGTFEDVDVEIVLDPALWVYKGVQ